MSRLARAIVLIGIMGVLVGCSEPASTPAQIPTESIESEVASEEEANTKPIVTEITKTSTPSSIPTKTDIPATPTPTPIPTKTDIPATPTPSIEPSPTETETPEPTPTYTPSPIPTEPPEFELGGHIRSWDYLSQMSSAGMNWVKRQVHYGQDASGLVA
ncbi:MAG: hypothetical protein JXA42_08395, partial [Anaerolineales bacterium]|nr:hypothetical protein [Anaerolineales bacterium]